MPEPTKGKVKFQSRNRKNYVAKFDIGRKVEPPTNDSRGVVQAVFCQTLILGVSAERFRIPADIQHGEIDLPAPWNEILTIEEDTDPPDQGTGDGLCFEDDRGRWICID